MRSWPRGGQGTLNQTGGTNTLGGNIIVGLPNPTYSSRTSPLKNGLGNYYLSGGLLNIDPTGPTAAAMCISVSQPTPMAKEPPHDPVGWQRCHGRALCQRRVLLHASHLQPEQLGRTSLLIPRTRVRGLGQCRQRRPGVFNQSSGTNAAGNLTIGQIGVLGAIPQWRTTAGWLQRIAVVHLQ